MRAWFTSQNEIVQGPYTVDEIRSRIDSGSVSHDALVWGRGQSEWMAVANWLKAAPTGPTEAERAKQEQLWHYAIQGTSKGPMPRAQLVNEIRDSRQKEEVLVWTKGMKAWADLFEFHDLLDEIGLNKREHPRASIEGQVVLRTEDEKTVLCQLKTISPGGIGVTQILEPLSIGQTVSVEIRSPALGEPIISKVTVQYVTDSTFVGLKFVSLSMENKSRIVQYLRQLEERQAKAA